MLGLFATTLMPRFVQFGWRHQSPHFLILLLLAWSRPERVRRMQGWQGGEDILVLPSWIRCSLTQLWGGTAAGWSCAPEQNQNQNQAPPTPTHNRRSPHRKPVPPLSAGKYRGKVSEVLIGFRRNWFKEGRSKWKQLCQPLPDSNLFHVSQFQIKRHSTSSSSHYRSWIQLCIKMIPHNIIPVSLEY